MNSLLTRLQFRLFMYLGKRIYGMMVVQEVDPPDGKIPRVVAFGVKHSDLNTLCRTVVEQLELDYASRQ